MTVWFVTGASRGLGAAIVAEALSRGDQVIAAARNEQVVRQAFPDAGEKLLAVPADVTRGDQVAAAVAAGAARFGRIDVLVNNAGRGLLGAVEEASLDEIRAVYETNVFGVLTVTAAVLPVMRAHRAGHIVNISSVGGFVGSPGWGVYASTKFAVEGFSEALRAELAPLGITVTIIEPGYFRTDFLDASSLHAVARRIPDYDDGPAAATRQRAAAVNHGQPGDPAKAAAAIADIAGRADAPARLPLGSDAVGTVEAKLQRVAAEVQQWRPLSVSTDHTD